MIRTADHHNDNNNTHHYHHHSTITTTMTTGARDASASRASGTFFIYLYSFFNTLLMIIYSDLFFLKHGFWNYYDDDEFEFTNELMTHIALNITIAPLTT